MTGCCMKISRLIFLLLLILSVIFLSCKNSRKALIDPIKEQGPDYLFKMLKKNEFNYSILSLKFNADLTIDHESNSFSGNIYIIKDSMIWLSIQKFGIEAIRLLISNDSVKMINRLQKTYFIGDFTFLNESFNTNFDYDMLQSVITGNDFQYYAGDVFKASIENKQYKLSTVSRQKLKKYLFSEQEYPKILMQDIWLDPKSFKMVKMSMKEVREPNGRKFECLYSDFVFTENQHFFPGIINIFIDDKKKITCSITYTRISPEKEESFPFNIPQNYSGIE